MPLADGTLRILDVHVNSLLAHPTFQKDMAALLLDHNTQFNPTGARGSIISDDDRDVHERASKTARVEMKLPDSDITSYDALMKSHPDLSAAYLSAHYVIT